MILSALASCGPAGGDTSVTVLLTDTIFDERTTVQRSRVDTIYDPDFDVSAQDTSPVYSTTGERMIFAIPDTGRAGRVIRYFEMSPGQENVVRLADGQLVKAEVAAGDVKMGKQRFRIGIMRPLQPLHAHSPTERILDQPDYLLLTPYGVQETRLSPIQDNVGPITRQTVFRVGRRTYHVAEADLDARRLVVKPLDDARGLTPTARLETELKRVPVRNLAGETVNVEARPGRELVIFFWGLGGEQRERDIVALDYMYANLSDEEREVIDIVLVNRLDAPVAVQRFVDEHDIQLPVYTVAPNTCRRLNCSPDLPYWVGVDAEGRVVSYHIGPRVLFDRLSPDFPFLRPEGLGEGGRVLSGR